MLELHILAEDILEVSYFDGKDCPITRALARAGHPELHDSGNEIVNDETSKKIIDRRDPTYETLVNRVISMYIGAGILQLDCARRVPEEPKDFTHILNIEI